MKLNALILTTALATACGIPQAQYDKDIADQKAKMTAERESAAKELQAQIDAAKADCAKLKTELDAANAKVAAADASQKAAVEAQASKTEIALAASKSREAQLLGLDKKFDDASKLADEALATAKAKDLPAAVKALEEAIAGMKKKDAKILPKLSEAAGFLGAAAK